MTQFFPRLLLVCALLTTWAMGNDQWSTPDPDDIDIDIKNFEIKTVRYDDVYPDMDNFGQGGKQAWLRILVEYTLEVRSERRSKYDVKNTWLDSVEFDWDVIIAPINKGNTYDDRRAIRLQKSINYANLKVDKRSYYAVVFVEPRLLQRYAEKVKSDDIFTKLVVKVGRKTQEEMSSRGSKFGTSTSDRKKLTAKARRVNDIWDSEEVLRPEYGLLSRLETPWSWSSYDQLETIVPQPK